MNIVSSRDTPSFQKATQHSLVLNQSSSCLIMINTDNIMLLSNETPTQPDIVSEFKDVFSGEGKLYLEIDKSVSPVALPLRKVPFAVKEL